MPATATLQTRLVQALEDHLPAAVALREILHRHPDISGREMPTLDRIGAAVQGMETQVLAGGNLLVTVGPHTGPAVGIRAELDALPLTEQTGVAFAADNGAMHACGHDVHMAALVGLLRGAATLDLPYRLVGIFQAREETYPSGAKDLVEAGVLEDCHIAHVIAAHVHPSMPRGSVSIAGGFVNAAADELLVRCTGIGGHGAYPENSSDVVAAMAHIATALPEITRRSVPQLSPAVISIGTMRAGTGAANVLPGEGEIFATVRTSEARDRRRLIDAVRGLANAMGRAFDVTVTVEVTSGEPALHNDAQLASGAEGWMRAAGYQVDQEPMRSLGADDFSYFSAVRPSVMAFVGVDMDGAARGLARTVSLHDPLFLPDPSAIADVAMTLSAGYLAATELIDGTAEMV